MANTLRFKRGLVAGIPTGVAGEPLFTTDTFDLYIGNGTTNTRFQQYIASGTTLQYLRGDGSLATFPTNIVTGTGISGQVAYWSGTNTQTGNNNLFWDITNGRLGIGTNVPSVDLEIGGTGTRQIRILSSGGVDIRMNADTGARVGTYSNTALAFHTNSTEKMRLDASGNLGLGVTPSAFFGTVRAMQIGLLGAFSSRTGGNGTYLSSNVYFTADPSDSASNANYIATTSASAYMTASGSHKWFIAPSGTAGNAITFTQAMTLTANGRLLLGTTTEGTQRLQVAGDVKFDADAATNGFYWDNTNKRLGIGINIPTVRLHVLGDSILQSTGTGDGTTAIRINNSAGTQILGIGAAGGIVMNSSTKISTVVSPTSTQAQLELFNGGTGNATLQSSTSYGLLLNPSGGNVVIGSTTNGTQRLQVTGDTLMKGSGNTSATTALTVQNSDAVNLFRVNNSGYYLLSGTNGMFFSMFTTSDGTAAINGTNTQFYNYTTTQAATLGAFLFTGNSFSQTSGAAHSMYIIKGFAPTSGTGTFSTLSLSPVINQTGGANGITRGLYVSPTLTAAADWRSIEWSNNTGWGLYGAGTAANYIGGALTVNGASVFNDTLEVLSTFTFDGAIRDNRSNTVISQSASSVISNRTLTIGNATYLNINFPNGNMLIGSTTDSGEKLQVNGTMKVTGASTFGGLVDISTGNSFIYLRNTSLGLDSKVWTLQNLNTSGDFRIRALNDADNNGINAITISRTGISSVALTFGGAATFSSSVTAGGGISQQAQMGLGISTANTKSSKIAVYDNIGNNFWGIGLTDYSSVFGLGLFAGTNSTGTPQVVVNSNGNVGINTTSPAYKLDISGTFNATGAATFSSTLTTGGNILIGASASSIGAMNLILTGTSPVASRLTFGTDGTGYSFAIGKNQAGTVTDLLKIADSGLATFTDNARFSNLKGCIFVQTGGTLLGSIGMDSSNAVTIDNNGFSGLSVGSNYTMTGGNLGIGHNGFGTSATRTLSVLSGTAPSTSPADSFQMYSNDVVAGNAAPHFRTENGAVIKLYQETTAVGNSTISVGGGSAVLDDTQFGGYTLRQVVKALQNQGILA